MRVALNGLFWNMRTTGSGQYLHHLIAALPQVAPQNSYELLVPRGAAERADAESVPLRVLPSPLARWPNLAKVWFEQVTFPGACLRAGFDLAHIPHFASPWKPTVPTVVTIHDLIPLILPEYRGSWSVRRYTQLVASAARQAAVILADSQTSARDIVRLLGIPGERVRVVHLAADPSYQPLVRRAWEPVVRRHGISPPYLLYLGGFDVRKNLIGLLQAYARVRVQVGTQLVIAGRLPERHSAFCPDPRRIAKELGLAGEVRFTGWVAEEDKPALYAGALAFVFPSRYEGFGLPVLEAIACGTPAIVGSGSSLEEIGGPGAIAVAADDVDGIGEAMLRLARSPRLRDQMGQAGVEHARRFSWSETARLTLQAYERACYMTARHA